jgi:GAF domain-containing protein/anti-sigma regulatory factor (Ser/Thr protein kinase)
MSAYPHSEATPPHFDDEAMLRAVYRAAERVTAELDLTAALEEIIACVRSPLGLDRAGVFLYRPHRQDLIRLIGVGRDGVIEHGPEDPIPIEDGRGPMQQVALGRIPYFLSHDVRREVPPEMNMPAGLGAHVIVPLVNRGEIIGVMAVDNMLTDRDIPERVIRPLCLFAQFAALALGSALRAQALGDLNQKLRSLAELAGTFSGILQPDLLLERALGELPALLRADRYSAWRRRSGRGWECVVSRGLSPNYLKSVAKLYERADRTSSLMERVLNLNDPVFISDAAAAGALRPYADLVRREGFQSIYSIPLCQGSEMMGCVNLYYDQAPDLTDQDWEIARLFARQIGAALRNAELFEARASLETQLRRVNQELESDRKLLLSRQKELERGEALKKQFYRDVLFCMTNRKLVLCDQEEIDRDWTNDLAGISIRVSEDIKKCRDHAYEHGSAMGMDAERLSDLCLCVSEAATNALKHAGGGQMSVSRSGGQFRVRVSDQGRGIDAMQLPHATLMRGYSTQASMGLGFTLMHEMSDRLCLATDAQGTTLILEMALHPESELDRTLAMLKEADF